MMMSIAFKASQALRPAARRFVATSQARCMATYYSRDHEWVSVDGDNATIGITDFAQAALGDLVYVQLPEVGDSFEPGDSFAAVESVKAANDVYSPVTCTVTDINEELGDEPGIVNDSPEENGWLMKAKLGNTSELDDLLNKEDYDAFCEEEDDH